MAEGASPNRQPSADTESSFFCSKGVPFEEKYTIVPVFSSGTWCVLVLTAGVARNQLIGDLLAGRRRSWCDLIGRSAKCALVYTVNATGMLAKSAVAVQNLEEIYTPMRFRMRGVDMSETDGWGMARVNRGARRCAVKAAPAWVRRVRLEASKPQDDQ
jgi:hypothetical protein